MIAAVLRSLVLVSFVAGSAMAEPVGSPPAGGTEKLEPQAGAAKAGKHHHHHKTKPKKARSKHKSPRHSHHAKK